MKKIFLFHSILILLLISCNNLEKDWKNAQKIDDISSYENFIKIHPKSQFDSLATSRILELKEVKDWEEALNINKIGKYTNFLSNWPQGQKYNEAIDSIWSITKRLDETQLYYSFLGNFPNNEYSKEIMTKIGREIPAIVYGIEMRVAHIIQQKNRLYVSFVLMSEDKFDKKIVEKWDVQVMDYNVSKSYSKSGQLGVMEYHDMIGSKSLRSVKVITWSFNIPVSAKITKFMFPDGTTVIIKDIINKGVPKF